MYAWVHGTIWVLVGDGDNRGGGGAAAMQAAHVAAGVTAGVSHHICSSAVAHHNGQDHRWWVPGSCLAAEAQLRCQARRRPVSQHSHRGGQNKHIRPHRHNHYHCHTACPPNVPR